MSAKRALCLAVRDQLRTELGLDYKACEVTFDGHPPPRSGKVFYAVHRGARRNQCRNSLDALYDVVVTVTVRVNEPYDRLGTDLLEKEASGLDDLVDAVIGQVHMNYDLMAAANATIVAAANAVSPGADVYGFSEPLGYESDDTPQLVGGDWFHADPEAPEVGLAARVQFGRARRLQPNGNLTQ